MTYQKTTPTTPEAHKPLEKSFAATSQNNKKKLEKKHFSFDVADNNKEEKTKEHKRNKSTNDALISNIDSKRKNLKKAFSKDCSTYYTTSPYNYNEQKIFELPPSSTTTTLNRSNKPPSLVLTQCPANNQKSWIHSDNMLNSIEQQQQPQQQSSQGSHHQVSSQPPPSPAPKAPRPPPRKPALNTNFKPPRALFCLTLTNPVRKVCIRICEYKLVLFYFVFNNVL